MTRGRPPRWAPSGGRADPRGARTLRARSPSPGQRLARRAGASRGRSGWRRARRGQGRDQRYVGSTPGLEPTAGARRFPGAPGGPAPVAVQFQPPKGLRPGQLGTLLDERANVVDVTATIVDLAVRGYLRIEEVERSGWFRSGDWRLEMVPPAPGDMLRLRDAAPEGCSRPAQVLLRRSRRRSPVGSRRCRRCSTRT